MITKKNLEKQISETDDPDKKAALQRDLDRERARRERQDSINQHQAQIASQIKSQAVADKRMQGGSRFNLRWSGSIPADQLSPQAVMQRLSDYVTFNTAAPAPAAGSAAAPSPAADASVPATAKLQRGMKMEDVTTLFGPGKQLSESVGDGGLKTQVYEYLTTDRRIEINYVDGLVVRYSISSK